MNHQGIPRNTLYFKVTVDNKFTNCFATTTVQLTMRPVFSTGFLWLIQPHCFLAAFGDSLPTAQSQK